MKNCFTIVLFLSINFQLSAQTECDIKQIYEAVEPESGITVLTDDDEIADLTEVVQLILSPLKLDEDKYKVEVSRKSSNLYKVNGQDIYIETRYCYEYATYDEVILVVESNYGYSKGKIIFID